MSKVKLYQRGEVWYVDYVDPDGKRIQKSLRVRDQKYAERIRIKTEDQLEGRIAGYDDATPLGQRIENRLEEVRVNPKKTQSRYKAYADHILRLLPGRAGVPTKNSLIRYRNRRLEEGASTATVNHELGFLCGLYPEHRWKGIRLPKNHDDRQGLALSVSQERSLLVASTGDGDFSEYLLGWLFSGVRKEELLPPLLNWEHWNPDSNLLTPINSKVRRRYTIPVHPRLKEVIERRRRDNLPAPFPYKWSYNQPRRKLKAAAKRAGIDGLSRLHDLRHTFASRLSDAGHGDGIIAALLGHSFASVDKVVRITRGYQHFTTEIMYKALVNSLDTGE